MDERSEPDRRPGASRPALVGEPSWLRAAARGLLAALAIALLLKYGRRISGRVEALDGWIAGLGWAAPAAFTALVAIALPLFAPATVLKAAAGAIFPPLLGVAVYLAGHFGAALVMYALGRRFLAGAVRRRVAADPRLAPLRNAAEQGTGARQFLVRMAPLSFALVCYALSALGVRLRPYLFGCLAAVPSTVVTVWFASAAHHAAVAADDPEPSRDPKLWSTFAVALTALALLMLFLRWLRPQLAAAMERRSGAEDGAR